MANRSYTKRFKVTKTGKVLRRTQGQGHSRAGKSRNLIRRRRNIGVSSEVDKAKLSAK